MHHVIFRRPLRVLVPMAAALVLLALISPWPISWVYVVVFLLGYGLLTRRGHLACTPEGVEVTVLVTRRIPWANTLGFTAGSWWRGGTHVLTTTGRIWSPVPASWWGGPATAADLAILEDARPRT